MNIFYFLKSSNYEFQMYHSDGIKHTTRIYLIKECPYRAFLCQ